MKAIETIESKIKRLSPASIRELDRYLDYLINKRKTKSQKKLNQQWAGGLKGINMTSVELQKQAMKWRQELHI